MKTKFFYFTLITMMCSVLFASGTVHAETYKFKFAHAAPAALAEGEVGIFIADRLNKETNGQIEATYFHSGKMGGEVEIFEKLQKGVLQGAFLSAAITSNYGPVINIINLPFMFPSLEAADRFRKSPLWNNVMQGLKKYTIGMGRVTEVVVVMLRVPVLVPVGVGVA